MLDLSPNTASIKNNCSLTRFAMLAHLVIEHLSRCEHVGFSIKRPISSCTTNQKLHIHEKVTSDAVLFGYTIASMHFRSSAGDSYRTHSAHDVHSAHPYSHGKAFSELDIDQPAAGPTWRTLHSTRAERRYALRVTRCGAAGYQLACLRP